MGDEMHQPLAERADEVVEAVDGDACGLGQRIDIGRKVRLLQRQVPGRGGTSGTMRIVDPEPAKAALMLERVERIVRWCRPAPPSCAPGARVRRIPASAKRSPRRVPASLGRLARKHGALEPEIAPQFQMAPVMHRITHEARHDRREGLVFLAVRWRRPSRCSRATPAQRIRRHFVVVVGKPGLAQIGPLMIAGRSRRAAGDCGNRRSAAALRSRGRAAARFLVSRRKSGAQKSAHRVVSFSENPGDSLRARQTRRSPHRPALTPAMEFRPGGQGLGGRPRAGRGTASMRSDPCVVAAIEAKLSASGSLMGNSLPASSTPSISAHPAGESSAAGQRPRAGAVDYASSPRSRNAAAASGWCRWRSARSGASAPNWKNVPAIAGNKRGISGLGPVGGSVGAASSQHQPLHGLREDGDRPCRRRWSGDRQCRPAAPGRRWLPFSIRSFNASQGWIGLSPIGRRRDQRRAGGGKVVPRLPIAGRARRRPRFGSLCPRDGQPGDRGQPRSSRERCGRPWRTGEADGGLDPGGQFGIAQPCKTRDGRARQVPVFSSVLSQDRMVNAPCPARPSPRPDPSTRTPMALRGSVGLARSAWSAGSSRLNRHRPGSGALLGDGQGDQLEFRPRNAEREWRRCRRACGDAGSRWTGRRHASFTPASSVSGDMGRGSPLPPAHRVRPARVQPRNRHAPVELGSRAAGQASGGRHHQDVGAPQRGTETEVGEAIAGANAPRS